MASRAFQPSLAGRGLIEKRHRPRADLMAVLPLEVEDGAPVLPEIVLWALNLQEGDLLTVQRGDRPGCFLLQSYLDLLERYLDLCADPWFYVEPLLPRPLAAVGPKGTLRLPEPVAARLAPRGGSLVLRRPRWLWELFELERTAKPARASAVSVKREQRLPILSGHRVILPAEVLWLLGLPRGGRLACAAGVAAARYEAASPDAALGDRSWAELAPDGTLVLPPSLCDLIDAPSMRCKEVSLSASVSAFQIELLVG